MAIRPRTLTRQTDLSNSENTITEPVNTGNSTWEAYKNSMSSKTTGTGNTNTGTTGTTGTGTSSVWNAYKNKRQNGYYDDNGNYVQTTTSSKSSFWDNGSTGNKNSGSSAWDAYMSQRNAKNGVSTATSVTDSADDYLTKLLNQYETAVNGLYNGVNTRYGPDYDKTYRTDTADYLDALTKTGTDLDKMQQDITNYVYNVYGEDSDMMSAVKSAFDTHGANVSKILESATQDDEYWKQFADEDDWKYAVENGRTHAMEQQVMDEYNMTWDEYQSALKDKEAIETGDKAYFDQRVPEIDAQIDELNSQRYALEMQHQQAQVDLDTDLMLQLEKQIDELEQKTNETIAMRNNYAYLGSTPETDVETRGNVGGDNWWGLIKNIDAIAGTSFGLNVHNTLNAFGITGEDSLFHEVWQLIGTTINDFGGNVDLETDPIMARQQALQQGLNYQQMQAAENAQSQAAQLVSKYGTMVWQQAPQMVMTLMSGPLAAATGLVGMGTEQLASYATAMASTNAFNSFLNTAGTGMANMLKNPGWWYSFTQETGSAYGEAIEDGASTEEAALYAIAYGIPAATIEVGGADEAAGGLQSRTLWEAAKNGEAAKFAGQWAKSIVEECIEEVEQGTLQNAFRGSYTDVNLYSDDSHTLTSDFQWVKNGEDGSDDKAIINPRQIGETVRDTAITTAIMGGAERVVGNTVNALEGSATYNNPRQSKTLVEEARTIEGLDEETAAKVNNAIGHYDRDGKITVEEARILNDAVTDNDVAIYTKAVEEQLKSEGFKPVKSKVDASLVASGIAKQALGIERTETEVDSMQAVKGAGVDIVRNVSNELNDTLHGGIGVDYANTEWVNNVDSTRTRAVKASKEFVDSAKNTRTEFNFVGDKVHVSAITVNGKGEVKAQVVNQQGVYRTLDYDQIPKEQRDTLEYLTSTLGSVRAGAEAFNDYNEANTYYASTHDGSELSIGTYAANYGVAYEYGVHSVQTSSEEYISNPARQVLGDAVFEQAYKAGDNSVKRIGDAYKASKARGDLQRVTGNIKNAIADESGNGKLSIANVNDAVIKDYKLQQVTNDDIKGREDLDFVAYLAKAYNMDIRLIKHEAGFDGSYASDAFNGLHTKEGIIYLDINAGSANVDDVLGRSLLLTLAHEMTHDIQLNSKKDYEALKTFVKDRMGEKQWDFMVRKTMAEQKLKRVDAEDEVVANSCERMLLDSGAARQLARENAGLFKKVCYAIEDFVNDIKGNYLPGFKQYRAESVALEKYLDQLQTIWDKGLLNTVKARKEGKTPVATKTRSEAEIVNQVAEENDMTPEEVETRGLDIDGEPGAHQFSVKSIVEGSGFVFVTKEDGTFDHVEDSDGNVITEATSDDILASPIGNMITYAMAGGFITADAAEQQCQMFADIMNLVIQHNADTMVWDILGTEFFSAIKNNSDTQYNKTIDFSTVCKKTQAVVDAMSEVMKRLGRGLTKDEVINTYLETNNAGETVPCPVCYVFSRWMGIGGVLNQIKRFQNSYGSLSEKELNDFAKKTQASVEEYWYERDRINKAKAKPSEIEYHDRYLGAGGKFKTGKALSQMKTALEAEQVKTLKPLLDSTAASARIAELQALLKLDSISAESKKDIEKQIKAQEKKVLSEERKNQIAKDAEVIGKKIESCEAYQFVMSAVLKANDDPEAVSENYYVKRDDFAVVPDDILFDLNKGDKFLETSPATWKYRTTRGAGMGKAILPYSDARVGETVQGVAFADVKNIKTGVVYNEKGKIDKKASNPWLIEKNQRTQNKQMGDARVKMRRQNLIGGMRYQSTSDFRYEYGSDYLMTFLEMQAMGANVQLYTKVIEAVDFLASMGADCNLSLMPLGDGIVEVVDENGNKTKKLVFSDVTGINYEAALQKTREYDNVQMILVGISDEHIRLAIGGEEITFVIPWHGSGNSVHMLNVLMQQVGEQFGDGTPEYEKTKSDYTFVQSDHVRKDRTAEQAATWDLRMDIITGKLATYNSKAKKYTNKELTAEQQTILSGNSYLQNLYDMFYLDDAAYESKYGMARPQDAYRNYLAKAQAEHIFPYEYWDTTLRIEDADQNGQHFIKYCESMGIIPRFSGLDGDGNPVGFGDFTQDKGYWKLLIDRRMYNLDGTYHQQQKINVSKFNIGMLDAKAASETYGDAMSKINDPTLTPVIADNVIRNIREKEVADYTDKYEYDLRKAKEATGTQMQLRGNPNAEVGININDGTQAFTDEIFAVDKNGNHLKTIETRNSPTLDEYIGQRVGIVRTGKNGGAILVGYATIASRVDYTSEKEFRDDYQKHRVKSTDPKFGWKGKTKYGYVLENVERESNPYAVTDRDPGNYTARDVTRDIQKPTDKNQRAVEKYKQENSPYSYKNLISKNNMPITSITSTVNNREVVIKNAKANALTYGHIGPHGETLVNVPDIGADVIVGTKGIRHGIDRRIADNGPATEKIGELLHNAVCVNELSPEEGDKQNLSYVLISAARDEKNHPCIVEMVVDKHTNELNEVNTLYSVNKKPYTNKKEPVGLKAPRFPGIPATFTDSEITIKQLLDFVNAYFPDIMSESVYREYKHKERPDGVLGKNAKFQTRVTAEQVREAAKNWGAIDNPYSDDMVFYHGTKGDFFRFEDRTGQNHEGYARLGSGHYFTATRNAAEFWAKKAKGEGNSHVMPVYLKTENLLNAYDKPSQDIIDALPEGINADSIMQIAQDMSEAGINSAEFFKGLGYDGIVSDKKTGKGYDRDNYEIVVFSPEQIKSAKTNTYDDAGNVIPLSERFNEQSPDIRFQKRDSAEGDYGYHAGDLGKSTVDDYYKQSADRGTGHFGFGTYFVGNEANINDSHYGKRPHEKVDFSKYNLFKPANADRAFSLHDALRTVDGYILKLPIADSYNVLNEKAWNERWNEEYKVKQASEDVMVSSYTSEEEANANRKIVDDYLAKIPEYVSERIMSQAETEYEDAQSRNNRESAEQSLRRNYRWYIKGNSLFDDEYSSEDDYVAQKIADEIETNAELASRTVEDWFYYFSADEINKYIENAEKIGNKLRRVTSELFMALGLRHSESEINSALKKTYDIVKQYDENERGLDSAATVFMKTLGYEGVDVRHLEALDNTGYGSVIYDLKGEDLARKKEIGTARFQLRNTERSDLQVLSEAFDDSAVTESEKKSLAMFKKQLQTYEAAEAKVSEALKAVKLDDTPENRKALQQARTERNGAQKVLYGMVENNSDLKKVIKAERSIMAEGTREVRAEFNEKYRELQKSIKQLKSDNVKEVIAAYDRGRTTGILNQGIIDAEVAKRYEAARNEAEKANAIKQMMSEGEFWNKVTTAYDAEIARLKEKRDSDVKNVTQYYRDMIARQRSNRKISAEEKRVRDKINDLMQEMRNRLSKPKENKYIPGKLVAPTIQLLESINTDYWQADKKIAELQKQIDELDENDKNFNKKVAELGAKISMYEERGDRFREKMAVITAEYEKLKSDADYSGLYDPVVANILQSLPDYVGSTPISKMNTEQLTQVHKALSAMYKVIKDSVNVKIGKEEVNAYLMARELILECKESGESKNNLLTKYWWDTQRPQVVFERFGGFKKDSYWSKMYRVLDEGQLKTTQLTMDLSRPFAELLADEKALQRFTGRTWNNKTDESALYDIGLVDEDGMSIKVPMDMVVSIYLDTMNEDNGRHMAYGGKIIPALDDYYKQKGDGGFGQGERRAMGYYTTDEGETVVIAKQIAEYEKQIARLEAALAAETDMFTREGLEQEIDDIEDAIKEVRGQADGYVAEINRKAFELIAKDDYAMNWVKTTRNLFNNDSKKALDKVTMDIYGFKKATVENYYPIRTDKKFRTASFESVTRDMSLENVGFMKERIHGTNPTLALGVSDMVNSQIAQTARYCGLMPAIRQFEKAYGKTMSGYEDSVQNALVNSMGEYGAKYIDNLMADLTGSRTGEPGLVGNLLSTLRGNLAQTTLTLNPRTALSQLASLPTAAATLGKDAIAYACNPLTKVDTNEIAEHSPLWWYRMQGYSSVELGDIKNSNDPMARLWKKCKWATGWIQAMDGLATSRLWAASKYYVEHTEGLTEADGAYWERVAEMFNKSIEETQPNYTTMQRPELLRSTNQLQRTMSMFMTQRLQNVSIMTDAINRYAKYSKDYKAGQNGVSETDVAGARNQLITATVSQLAAAAAIVAIKTIVNMLMSNMKAYRDDDDGEIDAKSFNLALLDMGVDTIVGNFWLGSNVYSFVKAATGHGNYYDFLSVSGVDTFNSLAEDFVNFANSLEAEEIDTEKVGKAFNNLAMDVFTVFGLPVPNAKKIADAVVYGVTDIINGDFLEWEASAGRTQAQWKNRLMAGYITGDAEAIADSIEALGGEKKAASAVKAYVKKDVTSKNPTIDMDTAVQYLVDWAGMDEDDAVDAYYYWQLVSENKDYSDLISQARYGNYKRYTEDSGVSVDDYIKYMSEADADEGGSISQEEMGNYLQQLVRSGLITKAMAEAIWKSQWHKENNKSYTDWLASN